MGKPNQYTAKQFIDNIPGTGGIITSIARKVGCKWHTAKKYIEGYPTINRAYQDECEIILDLAESELIKTIKRGEQWAVKYLLSTKGKGRGYTEKSEYEHTGKVDLGLDDAADKFDEYISRLIAARSADADPAG